MGSRSPEQPTKKASERKAREADGKAQVAAAHDVVAKATKTNTNKAKGGGSKTKVVKEKSAAPDKESKVRAEVKRGGHKAKKGQKASGGKGSPVFAQSGDHLYPVHEQQASGYGYGSALEQTHYYNSQHQQQQPFFGDGSNGYGCAQPQQTQQQQTQTQTQTQQGTVKSPYSCGSSSASGGSSASTPYGYPPQLHFDSPSKCLRCLLCTRMRPDCKYEYLDYYFAKSKYVYVDMNFCHNETISYKRWRFHKSLCIIFSAPSFIRNSLIMAKIHIIIGLKITEKFLILI